MNRTNYSLISALVDSKGGGLYNDVYIPIIKYAIVTLYYADAGKEYHKTVDVQEVIQKVFGLNIPIVVLKTVIQSLGTLNDISLTIYEKGDSYKITKAWDISSNETIDEKREQYESHFEKLETDYKRYKEREGVEDNISYIDFISDNTEEVLGYFENKDIALLDEKYSIIAHFLKHLQKSDKPLFNVANELFWGSIIAGFLRRSTVEIRNNTPQTAKYFIDTPLIMDILDLSTEERKNYAREMLNVIIASNGLARVHPITIREIKSILHAGENPENSYLSIEFASAYERRKLSPSKVVSIRTNLEKSLEELGISIFPNANDKEIDNIIQSYNNKGDVRKLVSIRKTEPRNIFRDIHDVYMLHYVRDVRKKNHSDCFFVTLNEQLIQYFRPKNAHIQSSLLHPSKIVLKFWMYSKTNSTSSLVANVLAEAMGRCIIMNERDVVRKLEIVSRYYNERSENFDAEVYNELVHLLYNRDAEYLKRINVIQENEENGRSGENNKQVLRMIEDVRKRQESDQRRMVKMQEEIDKINQEGEILRDKLDKETEKTRAQQQENDNLRKDLEKTEEENNTRKQLEDINGKLHKYEEEREKSISYVPYYLVRGLYATLIIVFLITLCIILYQYFYNDQSTSVLMWICGGSIGIVAVLFTTIKNSLFHPKIYKNDIKKKYEETWEAQTPEYGKLIEEKRRLENKIAKFADAHKLMHSMR